MKISDKYEVFLIISYIIFFVYFGILSFIYFSGNINNFSLNNTPEAINLPVIAIIGYIFWIIFYFTEFKRKYYGLESIYTYLKEFAILMPIYGWLLIIFYSLIVFTSLPAYLIVKKLPFYGSVLKTTYYCNSCELTSTIKIKVEKNNDCHLKCKYCDNIENISYKKLMEKEKILSTFITDLVIVLFFSVLIDQILLNRNAMYSYSQGEKNFVLIIAYVIPLTLFLLNYNYIFTTWLKEKVTLFFEKIS